MYVSKVGFKMIILHCQKRLRKCPTKSGVQLMQQYNSEALLLYVISKVRSAVCPKRIFKQPEDWRIFRTVYTHSASFTLYPLILSANEALSIPTRTQHCSRLPAGRRHEGVKLY
jgi:hypothetical protein